MNLRRPVHVLGHRGAAGVVPENTLAGFRYAIALGVDWVECDVHSTRDGRLVVIHDATVDRTTNGRGAVRGMTLERLRRLDAGGGEMVPTLDEVLETVRGRAPLECELKGEGIEEAVVAAVEVHGMAGQVVFSAFALDRLARVRRLGGHYRLAAILPDPGELEIARAAALRAESINVQYRNLCLRLVEQIRAAGLQVRAWNPDTLPEQQAMIALGVDGISTNRPDRLLAYLHPPPGKLPRRSRGVRLRSQQGRHHTESS
jgi:glycerophosphoryl diester phosphodiesterase